MGRREMNVAAGNRREGAGHVRWLLLIGVALCLVAASCGGGAARPVGSLQVQPCTMAGLSARCGTLIVPENRLTGAGRTIPVRFVVLPATGPGRSPDPVVWFAGGPGGSAVDGISWELPLLPGWNPRPALRPEAAGRYAERVRTTTLGWASCAVNASSGR